MKKIFLTSLVAVFAASGAQAATMINDNPLYRPGAKQFYSVTGLESHSENTNAWTASEDFGYGFTDKLAVRVGTSLSESNWFDHTTWNEMTFALDYRMLDMGNWKADVYGVYGVAPIWNANGFLEEVDTGYNWTIGARAGYMTDMWTVAGHVEFDYANSESFNWGDDGLHRMIAGVDGFLSLSPEFALLAGAEYTGVLDDGVKNAGVWTGKLGFNYNINTNAFVGAYITGEMAHATGDWELADGFGFGAKFGVQF